MNPKKDEYMRGYADGFKEGREAAAPAMLDAAKRLLSVFDEQAQILQRIVVGGRSDAALREDGNKAIAELRVAIAKAS